MSTSEPTAILQEWVDTLQDPGLVQTISQLRVERANGKVGYCCLGVLCEVMVKHGLVEREGNRYRAIGAARDEAAEGERDLWSTDVLPDGVWRYLGLGHPNPDVIVDHGTKRLATLNDEGVRFPEIADLIEARWLR